MGYRKKKEIKGAIVRKRGIGDSMNNSMSWGISWDELGFE